MNQDAAEHPETPMEVAAVDLGSNSFHMIVARLSAGQLQVVESLREIVRLASGLDQTKKLSEDAVERALACLGRFGERLRSMPSGTVRAVGTNTLRVARSAGNFLQDAERQLGHPIEVISGIEEARLVYRGAAGALDDRGRRLVVDIGGGSTEFIVGENHQPLVMDSLYMGCVSLSEAFFPKGAITRKAMERAETRARLEMETLRERYRAVGWDNSVGTSGTAKAACAVARLHNWVDGPLTPDGLAKLRQALLDAGHVDEIHLDGIAADRKPVFPGGVAILNAAFETLGIETMEASSGALREGLLHDLVGRIQDEDVRGRSVDALARRCHIDVDQADRVQETVLIFCRQVGAAWELTEDQDRMLGWAARLHEIGLTIAYRHQHRHGAYMVEHTDLAGFSWEEQRVLAALIRAHRRKFPVSVFDALPERWRVPAKRMATLLRLAVLLNRGRRPEYLPPITLSAQGSTLHVEFPTGWLPEHPLTLADLDAEADYLKAAKLSLTY